MARGRSGHVILAWPGECGTAVVRCPALGNRTKATGHPSDRGTAGGPGVVVRGIEEAPCTANLQFGGQVQINARFFDAGSGVPSDDVGASFAFSRASSDPKGQIFAWARIVQGFNYFGFVPIGHISTGTPVTATLTWDKTNHQFIATATNDITQVKMQITLPYSFSDNTPATNPTKDLAVVNFPANCTSHPAGVYTEATFDNVGVAQ
jgi:hypothetical protein